MRVYDFKGLHSVKDVRDLEAVLSARNADNFNSFELSHADEDYPALMLPVNDDLVAIRYLRTRGEMDFRPFENLAHLNANCFTTFWLSELGPPIDVANEFVVPFAVAMAAAREFFYSHDLPRVIKWVQL